MPWTSSFCHEDLHLYFKTEIVKDHCRESTLWTIEYSTSWATLTVPERKTKKKIKNEPAKDPNISCLEFILLQHGHLSSAAAMYALLCGRRCWLNEESTQQQWQGKHSGDCQHRRWWCQAYYWESNICVCQFSSKCFSIEAKQTCLQWECSFEIAFIKVLYRILGNLSIALESMRKKIKKNKMVIRLDTLNEKNKIKWCTARERGSSSYSVVILYNYTNICEWSAVCSVLRKSTYKCTENRRWCWDLETEYHVFNVRLDTLNRG